MKKWAEGPSGFMTIVGHMNMGRNMLLSFIAYLVVGVLVAYVAGEALTPGASFGRVFQITGTCGIMAYTMSSIPNSIWFNHGIRRIATNAFDGIVYGLATGLIFALLWPAANVPMP